MLVVPVEEQIVEEDEGGGVSPEPEAGDQYREEDDGAQYKDRG